MRDDLSVLLFEQAQILDGERSEDPAAFTARLNRLVARGLCQRPAVNGAAGRVRHGRVEVFDVTRH